MVKKTIQEAGLLYLAGHGLRKYGTNFAKFGDFFVRFFSMILSFRNGCSFKSCWKHRTWEEGQHGVGLQMSKSTGEIATAGGRSAKARDQPSWLNRRCGVRSLGPGVQDAQGGSLHMESDGFWCQKHQAEIGCLTIHCFKLFQIWWILQSIWNNHELNPGIYIQWLFQIGCLTTQNVETSTWQSWASPGDQKDGRKGRWFGSRFASHGPRRMASAWEQRNFQSHKGRQHGVFVEMMMTAKCGLFCVVGVKTRGTMFIMFEIPYELSRFLVLQVY